MQTFVVCIRMTRAATCTFCESAACWELHDSNNPNRKYAACEQHRHDAVDCVNQAAMQRARLRAPLPFGDPANVTGHDTGTLQQVDV